MNADLTFLPATAFAFLLVFARVGAMVMSLPGIGDRNVPVNIRLVFALTMTYVVYFVVQRQFPPLPPTLWPLLAMVVREVVIGVALGMLIRFVLAGLQIGGAIIGFQTGLSFATSFDPNFGGDGNILATFLSMMALTLVFTFDLHHLMLRGIIDSYELFQPAMTLPAGDFSELAIAMLAGAFAIAIKLSAPFIVFGLIFYLGVGILSRLIPQIQVFFIAQPAAILFSLILFMFLLSGLMMLYLSYFSQSLEPFLVDR